MANGEEMYVWYVLFHSKDQAVNVLGPLRGPFSSPNKTRNRAWRAWIAWIL